MGPGLAEEYTFVNVGSGRGKAALESNRAGSCSVQKDVGWLVGWLGRLSFVLFLFFFSLPQSLSSLTFLLSPPFQVSTRVIERFFAEQTPEHQNTRTADSRLREREASRGRE